MKPIHEQIILITGSTDGIGKITASLLAKQQAHVIIHGRSEEKVKNVVEELRKTSGNEKVDGLTADFSSLTEVRRLADDVVRKYSALDVLINNAGVGSDHQRLSKDGYELRFAVNYLAPFLFTQLLLPSLKNADSARVVNVSSIGQHTINFDDIMLEKDFDAVDAYRQSKLALIMFTIDLAERLKEENVTVNSMHPGTYLNTNMVRSLGVTPLGEAEFGADAEVYLATHPELDGITGKYFNIKKEAMANAQAYDPKARQQLRELSIRLTGMN